MALPQNLASSLLQQHVNAALQGQQASSTGGVQVIQPQMQAQQAQAAAVSFVIFFLLPILGSKLI